MAQGHDAGACGPRQALAASRRLLAGPNARRLQLRDGHQSAKSRRRPVTCSALCDDWTKLDDLERAGFVSSSSFAATIDRMVELTLLERSDRPPDPRASAMDTLQRWNPQAGFFHATTKDVPFVSPTVFARRRARASAPASPPPPAIKRYAEPSRPSTFRGPMRDGRARDTCSTRAARGVATRRSRSRFDELATILALSAGVQHWVEGGDGHHPAQDVAVRRRAPRHRVSTWSRATSRD